METRRNFFKKSWAHFPKHFGSGLLIFARKKEEAAASLENNEDRENIEERENNEEGGRSMVAGDGVCAIHSSPVRS